MYDVVSVRERLLSKCVEMVPGKFSGHQQIPAQSAHPRACSTN
jgi:hypothetical protein